MYGERRRRNINLFSDDQIQKQTVSIEEEEWVEEESFELEEGSELEEGYEYEESYSKNDDAALVEHQTENKPTVFLIDGKPFVVKEQAKKPTFQESHTRITTYLENNVYSIVKILQEQGQMDSITSFINESVKHYLVEKFQDKRNQ
jgi:hypothetical protein